MGIKLKIVQIGDPVLRQEARELTREEILHPDMQRLIEWMKVTMWDAPGVGLAAPQIGESLQIALIEDKKEYLQNYSPEQLAARERAPVPLHVIINPKITIEDTELVTFYEGCLSMTHYMALVPRARGVKVECLNERAEPFTIHAQGWYARILQHEIGHLQGNLYIDYAQIRSLTTIENYAKYPR